MWLLNRIKEPSSLAGLGLVYNSLSTILSTGHTDSALFATILAGIAAFLVPEATTPPKQN